jgi:hypothetical protein
MLLVHLDEKWFYCLVIWSHYKRVPFFRVTSNYHNQHTKNCRKYPAYCLCRIYFALEVAEELTERNLYTKKSNGKSKYKWVDWWLINKTNKMNCSAKKIKHGCNKNITTQSGPMKNGSKQNRITSWTVCLQIVFNYPLHCKRIVSKLLVK